MRWKTVVLLASFTAIMAGPAGAVTMSQINAGNVSGCGQGCFEIGDKQFTNLFSTFDQTQINVFGSQVGDTVFINFGGPFSSGNAADLNITYTVQAFGGLISMIDQSFVLTAAGTGGNVLIGEVAFNAANEAVANSSVSFFNLIPDFNDPPGELVQGDQLFVNPPLNLLHIQKDIEFQANQGGSVGATLITQSFHQVAVPEPGTLLLLGMSLVGIAGFARRRMRLE